MTNHIIGKLSELDKYVGLHPRFKKAFEFLKRDLAAIPDGKCVIDGEAIFASVESPKLRAPEAAQCEAHSKYIDIQVPLAGPETFGLCETPEAALDGAFKEKDIVFFDAPCEYVTLQPGEFAIFFPPYGGHKPGLVRREGAPVTGNGGEGAPVTGNGGEGAPVTGENVKSCATTSSAHHKIVIKVLA